MTRKQYWVLCNINLNESGSDHGMGGFFSLLKKEKNKFEIVCIWLRIFMNYSPLFPHHIFYPVHLCVVRNKSLRGGWGGKGKKAVTGLGIHQVPGTLVSPSPGVPRPPAPWLRSEGNPSRDSDDVFGVRVLNANTAGINVLWLLWFLSYSPHVHQSRKFNINGFMTWVPSAERDN